MSYFMEVTFNIFLNIFFYTNIGFDVKCVDIILQKQY